MVHDYCISIYLPGNPESNSNNIESVRPWLSDPIQLSAILEIDFSLNPLPDEILFTVMQLDTNEDVGCWIGIK